MDSLQIGVVGIPQNSVFMDILIKRKEAGIL